LGGDSDRGGDDLAALGGQTLGVHVSLHSVCSGPPGPLSAQVPPGPLSARSPVDRSAGCCAGVSRSGTGRAGLADRAGTVPELSLRHSTSVRRTIMAPCRMRAPLAVRVTRP